MNSKDLGYNWEEKHLNQFIYGPKKILAYCHIPKAASTWWLSVFAASFGYPEKEIDRMDKTMVRKTVTLAKINAVSVSHALQCAVFEMQRLRLYKISFGINVGTMPT